MSQNSQLSFQNRKRLISNHIKRIQLDGGQPVMMLADISNQKMTAREVCKCRHNFRALIKSIAFVALTGGYALYNRFESPSTTYPNPPLNRYPTNGHVQSSRLKISTQQSQHGNAEPLSPLQQNRLLAASDQVVSSEHRRLSERRVGDTAASIEGVIHERWMSELEDLNISVSSAGDDECEELEKADPVWWLVFYFIGVLYLFFAIAIVCDDFFVETLDEMRSPRRLNIDRDVAGATLMAAGGSAPELFTNLFGTFDESEIGFGTIVGSAVFNVMLVIAMCSIFAKETLDLSWWPLFRDTTYYAIGLVVLGLFVAVSSPEEIEIWEACVLFIMYIGYVLIMWKNRDLHKTLTGRELIIPQTNHDTSTGDDGSRDLEAAKEKFDGLAKEDTGTIDEEQLRELLTAACPHVADFDLDEAVADLKQHQAADETTWLDFSDWYRASVYIQRAKKSAEGGDEDKPFYAPLLFPEDATACGKMWHFFQLPILAALTFTVPDVRRPGMGKFCYLAFLISILWIGFFAYFMVAWAEIIGNTIGVPHIVMGYTILAAGTSVPDLLSSVIVTRQGSGDMAISSSIGSNIFDILVGLPIPWLIFMAFPSKPNRIAIESEHIWISIFVFLGMLVLVIAMIHCQKWRLTKTLGAFICLLYFIFLAQAIILELPFKACV